MPNYVQVGLMSTSKFSQLIHVLRSVYTVSQLEIFMNMCSFDKCYVNLIETNP